MRFLQSLRSALPALGATSFVLLAGAAPALHAQSAPRLNRYGNPERLAPAPTSADITVRDLQIRLYQFADDSMMGRQVGRLGNKKGTDYIAAEVKRLGLLPAGDNGTYFQVLPYHLRYVHRAARASRWTATRSRGTRSSWPCRAHARRGPIASAEVIFGGTDGDTTTQISADAGGRQVRGAAAARGEPWRRQRAAAGVRRPPWRRRPRTGSPMRWRWPRSTSTRSRPAQRRAINAPTVATAGGRRRAARRRAARRERRGLGRPAQGAARRAAAAGHAPHHARRRRTPLRARQLRRPRARQHRRHGDRVARLRGAAHRVRPQRGGGHPGQRSGAAQPVRRHRRAQRPRGLRPRRWTRTRSRRSTTSASAGSSRTT